MTDSDHEGTTFEATKALEVEARRADNIIWKREVAFRNQPYRHLHHQRGKIGTIQIRLVEAAGLKRSYWSPLALGPVKHLGLSKAHGAVSSCCLFSMQFEDTLEDKTTSSAEAFYQQGDRKPAPKPKVKYVSSPTIPQDDNPVWNNCQLILDLEKGAMKDGQQLMLQVRVEEDATALENLIPGIPSRGDDRLLGEGTLNITSLCLGQSQDGHAQVGVLDAWIPIRMPKSSERTTIIDNDLADPLAALDTKKKSSKKRKGKLDEDGEDDSSITGRVRVLVSYQPHGMEPQTHDVVALEAFARRNLSNLSCRPILPPLAPYVVKDTSGPWLLLEYRLPRGGSKACLRVHRNSVFVVERKNIVDETINLALLPADAFLNTGFGRASADLAQPMVVAGRQLIMPALLSWKLVWMAVRTTTLAGVSGVTAATSALWHEGSSSLTNDDMQEEAGAPRLERRSDSSSKYKFVSL